jgi:hypothetical protein
MTSINNEILTFLLNHQKPGVIAFVNEIDQKVAIIYRKSVIEGITTFIKECNEGSYPHKDLEKDYRLGKVTINILDVYEDISDVDLKLEHTKFVESYKNYSYYYKHKVLTLKVKTYINGNGEIHVQLVNRNNDKITVGIFKNFESSEKFVLSYYKDSVYKVVYDSSVSSIRTRSSS